ncbi:MAG: histidine phosphotransferase [Alphaproteobacteria bacterium]|nr:MAG: histidine phosphotransferase [Alphaproteobacteria bacterium]
MTGTVSAPALELEALVASRLCHDLINPIGAVGNGVELLQAVMPGSAELQLIDESVRLAMDKVRFYRIAFGAASPSEQIDARQITEILQGLYGSGRIRIEWPPRALPRPQARLMFLAIQCAESALPVGGTLTIVQEEGCLRILAEARRMRFEPALWAHLTTGAPLAELRPAEVHFPLARRRAEADGLAVSLAEREGGFDLAFTA